MSVPLTRLGRPARPRDGGLASLGVVMMATAIACGGLAWCAAVIAAIDAMCSMALADGGAGSLLSRASGTSCLLAIALTIARGLLGYRAGQALACGRDARARLGGYVAIGLGHAVAVATLIAPTWSRTEVAAVATTLAALPLAALVVVPWANAAPRAGAREAVPVLALLAGVVTLVVAAALLVPSLHLAGAGLDAAGGRYVLVPALHAMLILGTGLGVIAAGLAIALAVVGALLVHAGLRGEPAAIERASLVSGFVAFLVTTALSILVLTAVAIPAVVALGMAFPELLRREATAGPPRPHDPGHGRAALGWILLGHGLLAAAALLPAAIAGAAPTMAAAIVAAPCPPDAPLLGIGVAALELVAAAAFLAGWPGARLLAITWSALGLAVAASVGIASAPVIGAWFAAVPLVALGAATRTLTETLRARARLVRSFHA